MRDRTFRRLMIMTDAISLAFGWSGAYWLRALLGSADITAPLNPFESYALVMPLIVGLSMIANASFGLYRFTKTTRILEETLSLVRASMMSLLVVMALGFLFRELEFGRAVVLFYGLITFTLLSFSRAILRKIRRKLHVSGRLEERVLIVGGGTTGIRAMQKIEDHQEIGYRVIGFLDDDTTVRDQLPDRAPRLGGLADLRKVVQKEQINEVIFAIPSLDHESIMSLIMNIDDFEHVRARVVSDLFGVLAHETDIDLIEDVPIFELKGPSEGTMYRLAKRLFDLTIVLTGAIPTLFVCLPIAIAIKLDSKGPILFVQERVGKGGKLFNMYKFRTMTTESDPYAVAPADNQDARITSLGRFLRKTSLDELPQLLNVLIGNMSIVGPRPEMPFIVETYEPWQRKRLEVKPGITGLWQILGRKDLPLHENLEYDFYYIKNRSIMMDITILLRTIPATIIGRGAY